MYYLTLMTIRMAQVEELLLLDMKHSAKSLKLCVRRLLAAIHQVLKYSFPPASTRLLLRNGVLRQARAGLAWSFKRRKLETRYWRLQQAEAALSKPPTRKHGDGLGSLPGLRRRNGLVVHASTAATSSAVVSEEVVAVVVYVSTCCLL